MPRHPRPLAHRLAAFGVAGLFSLGVLAATFRDTTRSIIHSAALPTLARLTLGEPGAEWAPADGVGETQYAAERERAAAELAQARAETDAMRAANVALLERRETHETARVVQPKRRPPTRLATASVVAPAARLWHEPAYGIEAKERRAIRRAWAVEGVAGACAARRVHGTAVTLDVEQLRLAVAADLPRRLAASGELDAATIQRVDSMAKYVAVRLDTAALHALSQSGARFACG